VNGKRVVGAYFSPTGTTRKTVCHIAGAIGERMGIPVETADFTPIQAREQELVFQAQDVVVFGVPVYAGRVPNVLLKYLHTIKGNKAHAVAVVLYGNRHFDDALAELKGILTDDGFYIVGAGAFVGEHAFSKTLAAGRPDQEDLALALKLAGKICDKWQQDETTELADVPGRWPSPEYYKPRDRKGNFIDLRKIKPCVNDACDGCGLCVRICPMGSIDSSDVKKYSGICIKCGACIKGCPKEARYYEDAGYLYHKKELEEGLKLRSSSAIWY